MSENFWVNLTSHEARMVIDYVDSLSRGRTVSRGEQEQVDRILDCMLFQLEVADGKKAWRTARSHSS